MAEPSPTSTTKTAACVGDCNDDAYVTIDEIIQGVNIALGLLDIEACDSFDSNHDGEVTIDELLQGVNAALTGCDAQLQKQNGGGSFAADRSGVAGGPDRMAMWCPPLR